MIIFDICHTLYKANTTFDFIDFINKRNQKITLLNKKIFKIPIIILGKLIKKDLYRILYIKKLKGYSYNELQQLAYNYVEYISKNKKIDETHKILHKNLTNKSNIILCSASLDIIVEAISKKLGVDKYLSTQLLYTNGYCDGVIKKDLLGNKAELFNENIDLVVTDNKSDLNLILKSKDYIIISRPKDIKFWNEHKLNVGIIVDE